MKKTALLHILFFVLAFANGQAQVNESYQRKLIPGRTIETFYHHKLKKIILINGCYDPGAWHTQGLELWQWNNNTWQFLSENGPEVRNGFGSAYDSKRGKLVIYGGTVAPEPSNRKWFTDTWEWDGENWMKIETPTNPGTRFATGMTYDPIRKKCVLFGGADSKFDLHNDTWAYDGKVWQQIFSDGPSTRWPAAMFYFPPTKKIYVYGGNAKNSNQRGLVADTWELNEDGWKEIESASVPGKQEGVEIVFNEKAKEIWMVCGGSDTPNKEPKFVGTTWAFDGKKWRTTDIKGLPPRGEHGLTYNPKTKSILSQGGFNIGGGPSLKDTWLLEPEAKEWKCIAGCFEEQKQWLAHHPNDADALLTFIATSYYTGKLEKIAIPVSNALTSAGISANVYKKIGNYLIAIKQFYEGILCLEKSLTIQPKGADFYNLACIFATQNDNNKAFENLFKAVDNGFNQKAKYETDTNLTSLKQDARWKELHIKLK